MNIITLGTICKTSLTMYRAKKPYIPKRIKLLSGGNQISQSSLRKSTSMITIWHGFSLARMERKQKKKCGNISLKTRKKNADGFLLPCMSYSKVSRARHMYYYATH